MTHSEKIPLVQLIDDLAVSDKVELPVFNPVALRLQQLIAGDDFHMKDVSELIHKDQALVSQVLRLANSAFFSGLKKTTTLQEAIVRLGTQQLVNLVTVATQAKLHSSKNSFFNKQLNVLWHHSLACALGSKWLAEKCGYRELASVAFLGGLLHDIGKLFLLKVLEEISLQKDYKEILTDTSVVPEVLNSLHAEKGAQIMVHWNLPEIYCHVARDHHSEEYDSDNTLLILVRVADMACMKEGISLTPDESVAIFTTPEAQELSISEIQLSELLVMLEDSALDLTKLL